MKGGYLLLEYLKPGTKKTPFHKKGVTKPHNLSVREELVIYFWPGFLTSGSF
jgi:hypothetical protein